MSLWLVAACPSITETLWAQTGVLEQVGPWQGMAGSSGLGREDRGPASSREASGPKCWLQDSFSRVRHCRKDHSGSSWLPLQQGESLNIKGGGSRKALGGREDLLGEQPITTNNNNNDIIIPPTPRTPQTPVTLYGASAGCHALFPALYTHLHKAL